MPRGSDVLPLRESADIYLASRSGREAVALRPLARGEGDQPKGRHFTSRTPRRSCHRLRNSILWVAFTRGEIQLRLAVRI